MYVWQSVKVKTADHPREGQAGIVFSTNEADPSQVGVRFDIDRVVELVNVSDLVAL